MSLLVTRSSRTQSSLQYPRHSPAYLSVIPGISGPGMDTPGGTGRNLATPQSNLFLIDTLSTANTGSQRPELGPRTWSGSPEYCCRASVQHKIVMPICSGDYQGNNSLPLQQGTPPTLGNVSYIGQGAPSPGFFFRGTRPHGNGASNLVIMHMHSWMGDDPAGLGANSRDCFGSGYGGGTTQHVCVLYSTFGQGIDEIVDFYRPHHLVTLAYNAFVNPLHRSTVLHPGDPAGTDHGFGPILGGDTDTPELQPGTFAFFRNYLAHITGRGPASTAQLLTVANNLYYNCGGRPGGGNGEAIDIWAQATTQPMLANIMGNGFIRGPEHTSSMVAVRVRTGVPAGTHGYLSNNAQFGWGNPGSQANFVTSAPSGYVVPDLTAAIPGSWGDGEGGVLQWAANPLQPTLEEWLAYHNLHNRMCGAQPRYRSTSYGSLQKAFDQAQARLMGGSTSFQFVDTSEEDGAFSVPFLLVDPLNPGIHHHAPMPTGSDRDDLLLSGTLLNGDTAVGRTRFEAWYLNQHFYVLKQ